MSIAVSIQGLCVGFNEHSVLKDISFEFAAHTISVLVGRSGSGKTTFLRTMNRLNEEFPGSHSQGHIAIDLGQGLQTIFDDSNTKKVAVPLPLLRHKVGMLFQTPQLLPVSIYRNIAMPLQLVGQCPAQDVKERVSEILKTVGLWDEVQGRLDLPAEKLSGGQQQRLCLARTLALEPTVLLLDEPTGSLDINSTREIETLLLQLKERYTIIMVSHSLQQACRLADELLVFEQGKIAYILNDKTQMLEADLARIIGSNAVEH